VDAAALGMIEDRYFALSYPRGSLDEVGDRTPEATAYSEGIGRTAVRTKIDMVWISDVDLCSYANHQRRHRHILYFEQFGYSQSILQDYTADRNNHIEGTGFK
jgi:hypothetical protein